MSLARRISECMLCDQPRLRRRLRDAARQGHSDSVDKAIEASIARRQKRLESLPKPAFPADLPITAKREEIARAIDKHQVVVICGETGSGKTTQLPKVCLGLGRGAAGMIGHTQPRRIAARSTAARIAEELRSPLGTYVGYKVRFTDTTPKGGDEPFVKIMTDGILLAEARSDPLLLRYDTIIIDEAHERSINIDFVLGYLKQLLPKRPELKIIITSATIDPQRFSAHFDSAPIIEVSGRTYPVEARYRPLVSEHADDDDRDLRRGVLDAVDEAMAHGPGDILVFLSGEREIRETARSLTKHAGVGVEVLPLYARLTIEEQNRVFSPHTGRRIVLATNVAETSLTVPGIRYVIDSGRARVSRYSARSGVQRLPIEPISRASAQQRAGRCGRISPGVCIRLYSEEDFLARDEFTPPEILRTNLASVILQLKSLRFAKAIEKFPFVDPPRWAAVSDAHQTLHELGALDQWGEITRLGEELARLPIDPRLGRMILAARSEGCVRDVLVIAAALAIQDPRDTPHEAQDAARSAHREFADSSSDFLTLLNIWRAFHSQAKQLTGRQLRMWCSERYLSYVRMREWADVHGQLRDSLREGGGTSVSPAQSVRTAGTAGPPDDRIHRAVLAGLLSRIGVKGRGGAGYEYTGAHGRKFHIFPGSAAFRESPPWIVAAEIIETTKLYAHTIAPIKPKWIEHLASHLVQRTYSQPHWRRRPPDACAWERVTLFGLELVAKRRVKYGPIDPKAARDLFIQEALVAGRYDSNAPFMAHNRRLIEEIRAIEEKTRRRGVLADDAHIFAFYDARIPPRIHGGRAFEEWRVKAERRDPQLLFMTRELLKRSELDAEHEAFPDHIEIGGVWLPLAYRFEPGHPDDGVTLTVPSVLLPQLDARRLEWLVPGLLEEKVTAMIRALPKHIRRNFVPAPEWAGRCAARLTFGEGSLPEQVRACLHRLSGIEIPADDHEFRGPPHLHMNVRVVHDDGKVIASGRDVTALRGAGANGLPTDTPAAIRDLPRQAAEWGRVGITSWDFGDLPEEVTIERAAIRIRGWPALIDDGDSVSMRAMDSRHAAERATRAGIRRLIMLRFPDEMRYLADQLPGLQAMSLDATVMGIDGASLRNMLLHRIIDTAFLHGHTAIRTAAAFEACISGGWHNLQDATERTCAVASRALRARHALEDMLCDLRAPLFAEPRHEIAEHLAHLLPRTFLIDAPGEWFDRLPRYLSAVQLRIEKLSNGKLARDRQLAAEIEPLWRQCLQRQDSHRRQGIDDPELESYRWMLEELRVSLFAQELGAAMRISRKRLDEQWRRVAP